MKLLKKILKITGIVLLLLFVISVFLPSKAHVERSITIKASKSVVFNQINILKNWEKWSPWHQLDTAMKLTYSGPDRGVGAKYSWSSEDWRVGKGSLDIAVSTANDSIICNMILMEPDTARGGFYLTASDTGTVVRWTMDCDNGWNPFMKYMSLMMDGMVGKDFEKGLNSLKTLAESLPAPTSESSVTVEESSITSVQYVSIMDSCSMQEMEMVYPKIYAELTDIITKSGAKKTGPAMNVTYNYDPAKIVFAMCIPVDKEIMSEGSRIKMGKSPEGKIATAMHWGDYNKLPGTYEALQVWINKNGKTIIGAPWEIYHVDPSMEKDMAKWKTQVFFPIQ